MFRFVRLKCVLRLALLALAVFIQGAFDRAIADDAFREIETKYIFGFTEGSGIGLEGEKEFSPDSVTAIGKRDGKYVVTQTKLKYEFTPNQYMQFELGPIVGWHNIQNVTDLDNRNQFSFSGAFVEFRYLLLDRPASPLAVTLAIEPEWRRTDETTGETVTNFGLEMRINADLQVVPNRLYLGWNLLYEPETTRSTSSGWTNESTIGVSSALAFRVVPWLTIGGEVWYLRHYDGVGLNAFTGDAVFAGPNVYVQLDRKMFVTAAWNTQVTGRDLEIPGRFNLNEFARHRVKLKFAVEF